MRKLWLAVLILVMALPLWSQTPAEKEKWTVGTVMAFKPHTATNSGEPASPPQYEITVRVGRTEYVVLYTERPGTAAVEYAVGRDAPVLVGAKTLSFRDKLGRKADLPILSKKVAESPAKDRQDPAPKR